MWHSISKHHFYFLIALLIVEFLLANSVQAVVTNTLSLSSNGQISYPNQTPIPTASPTPTSTPMPTLAPSSKNLVPSNPNQWMDTNAEWNYINIDNSVTYNEQSTIRLDADNTGRDTRECATSYGLNVHPGDHIVISAMVKTGNYTNNFPFTGARIGMGIFTETTFRVHKA